MICQYCGDEITKEEESEGLCMIMGNSLCHKACYEHQKEEAEE